MTPAAEGLSVGLTDTVSPFRRPSGQYASRFREAQGLNMRSACRNLNSNVFLPRGLLLNTAAPRPPSLDVTVVLFPFGRSLRTRAASSHTPWSFEDWLVPRICQQLRQPTRGLLRMHLLLG